MAQTNGRARGEDSIYYDRSRDRWTGTITVGWKLVVAQSAVSGGNAAR